jgi:hypothetical protein
VGVHNLVYTFTYPNGCTGQDTMPVLVEICMGVMSIAENSLVIYPQPAHDYLTVELSGLMDVERVTLYSLQGQRIYVNMLRTNGQLQIDLRDLAPGIYFLQTENNGIVNTCRVVKQ